MSDITDRKDKNEDRGDAVSSRENSQWGLDKTRPAGQPGSVPAEGDKSMPPILRVRRDIVPEPKFSFETPPDPIPEKDIKQTISADVIVVGAGVAGMSATLAAVEAGAKVILIEKMRTFQARGYDNAFIGSRLQNKLGIKIDANEVVLNLMKYGANKPDQRLIRMWAEGSGETADWLLDMTDAAGIELILHQYPPPAAFNNANEYYPQYLVTHTCKNEGMVVQCLMDNALKKGAVIHFDTRAKQLIKNETGGIAGVIAQNTDKEYIKYMAKAVILCTGDYGYNSEMMAKYCSHVAYLPSTISTSTGDGHIMAMWAGAMMERAPHAPISHGFAGPLGNVAFLQVNLRGERFHNEDVPGQSYANAIERQPGQAAWQVFDSKYARELKYMGIGHGKTYDATKVDSPDFTLSGLLDKMALKADTIEDLAQKMGIPVSSFKATVDRYNHLARLGKDLDFGKRSDRLTTLDTPPFYAGKGRYHLLCIMGGIMVNTRLEALDKDWNPIHGLYMAGNTMGGRFAVDYPTMTPGVSHGMCIHFGRLAGTNAAALR